MTTNYKRRIAQENLVQEALRLGARLTPEQAAERLENMQKPFDLEADDEETEQEKQQREQKEWFQTLLDLKLPFEHFVALLRVLAARHK